MRRSSQIGFGASVGLAIFSASFVADFSSERQRLFFWPQASAGMPNAATMSIGPAKTLEHRAKRKCQSQSGKAGASDKAGATAHDRSNCATALDWAEDESLPSKVRRQALLNHVQQKLARPSEAGNPILP